MSKSRGEGRSKAEKQQRVVAGSTWLQREKKRREKEEREWASKSGPVTVRYKESE